MAKKITFGSTDHQIYPLGFGGIPISRVSKKEAVKAVKGAVAGGVNFIDTAIAYGDSEEKIGAALKEIETEVFLASKTPAKNSKEAREDLEESLRNLGLEKINLYQLHNVSSEEDYENQIAKDNSALKGLQQAKSEGLIEHIGVTGHADDLLIRAIKEENFASVQFCYNFIEYEAEEKLLPLAREMDLGLIAMKPLAGGRLEQVDLALKYILHQGDIIAIPGMETSQEVEENLAIAAAQEKLTGSEKEKITELREEIGDNFCRRCGYCLPCPEDIAIPMVLRVDSFINRMTPEKVAEWLGDKIEPAENCQECEICVERCPFDLPIPGLIKENVASAKKRMD